MAGPPGGEVRRRGDGHARCARQPSQRPARAGRHPRRGRDRDQGLGRARRHGNGLAPARHPRDRRSAGRGVYYGAGRSEAVPVRGRAGHRRRRRELRRPGGAEPRGGGRPRDDARPRRPPRQDHVGVPRPADRAEPDDRRPPPDAADRGPCGRRPPGRDQLRRRRRPGGAAGRHGTLHLHRREPAHGLVPAGTGHDRRRRLHQDRLRPPGGRPAPRALAAGPRPLPARDKPPGSLRRGRRPPRLDETRRPPPSARARWRRRSRTGD